MLPGLMERTREIHYTRKHIMLFLTAYFHEILEEIKKRGANPLIAKILTNEQKCKRHVRPQAPSGPPRDLLGRKWAKPHGEPTPSLGIPGPWAPWKRNKSMKKR